MVASSMLHVRVEDDLRAEAAATLALMGLPLSEAVRVFLMRVVADQAFPFAIKVPNPATRAIMEEARAMSQAQFAKPDALFDSPGQEGG